MEQGTITRTARVARRVQLVWIVLLLGVAATAFVVGRASAPEPAQPSGTLVHAGATMLKPGPWGVVDFVPMTIAPPTDILPVRALEAETIHWILKGMSRDEWVKLLSQVEITERQKEQLTSADVLHVTADGLDIVPPRDVVVSLYGNARKAIYNRLATNPDNYSQLTFLKTSSVPGRLKAARISSETEALFHKLTCTYGDYTVLGGLPCLLSAIPSFDEKVRLLKELTRQKTLMLKLHVSPDSDIAGLAAYWGKACWATDVHSMLDSLSRVPTGTWIDIVEVLPPIPTAQIYNFPLPDNPTTGPPVRRDCHWTSFNFFRDTPDPNFSDTDYAAERLKKDYFPVKSDPRYGDIVMFALPNGNVIHSAVFLADDIVYTKNGENPLRPWMLSTIADLMDVYSFAVPPGEKLTISYYRSKSY